ncbi:MAG: hypothetical protein KBC42_03340 [Candidatus Pacebacteria bacterium]|jgi:hypothetical protein|nr:hypothetical protein [Candidatus Paceibacterota bacterium]MBP9780931.1 hypothetical protein [Candidatus Paceibacterota bacterium]MDQ5961614.1 hypothetical protein [Patescibacteria group bacterium]
MAHGNLGDFLSIFKNLLSHEELVREDIISSIETHTGIVLEKKQLTIKNSVCDINTHPAVKNEIFLKKKEIMNSLRESTHKKISDIR